MYLIEASKKNEEIVNQVIQILHENECTIEEAYGILDFTKRRVLYTSKVGKQEVAFSEE